MRGVINIHVALTGNQGELAFDQLVSSFTSGYLYSAFQSWQPSLQVFWLQVTHLSTSPEFHPLSCKACN